MPIGKLTIVIAAILGVSQTACGLCATIQDLTSCLKTLEFCRCTNNLTLATTTSANLNTSITDLEKMIKKLEKDNDKLKKDAAYKAQKVKDLKDKLKQKIDKVPSLKDSLNNATKYAIECRNRSIHPQSETCLKRSISRTDVVACQGSHAVLQCPGKAISIVEATYGRVDYYTCSQDLTTNGCFGDKSAVTQKVNARCSGKSSCDNFAKTSNAKLKTNVLANNGFQEPCKGVLKNLDVIYTCD